MPTSMNLIDPPRRAAVFVAHSSPVISLGLTSILADRRGTLIELVDVSALASSLKAVPRPCLTIGDAAGMRAHQRRHPRFHSMMSARLMIASNQTEHFDPPAPWLALDCPETELLAAVDRWLDDGRIGAALGGTPGRGFAPGMRARMLAHIERHLGEPLNAAGLARLVGLSTCHFARAFKQSFGAPPHRFILRRRLEQAARRLRHQHGSLSEIALDFGFSDQSHFTRCFGRWLGETPSAYRDRHRGARPAPVDPA